MACVFALTPRIFLFSQLSTFGHIILSTIVFHLSSLIDKEKIEEKIENAASKI